MLIEAPKRPKEDTGGEKEEEVRTAPLIGQASSHKMVLGRQIKLCSPVTGGAGKLGIDRVPLIVLYVNELQRFEISLGLISATCGLFY